MLTALEDLLDQTREAVLAGNLGLLADLGPRIEAEAATLARQDRPTAERLLRKAERNAALLVAAGRGVRAAQGRLKDIANGPSLTTYDALGRKASIGPLAELAPRRA